MQLGSLSKSTLCTMLYISAYTESVCTCNEAVDLPIAHRVLLGHQPPELPIQAMYSLMMLCILLHWSFSSLSVHTRMDDWSWLACGHSAHRIGLSADIRSRDTRCACSCAHLGAADFKSLLSMIDDSINLNMATLKGPHTGTAGKPSFGSISCGLHIAHNGQRLHLKEPQDLPEPDACGLGGVCLFRRP